MAKPIERLPAFTGSAAKWLTQFLATPKDEKARQERRREDKELLQRVRPLQRK